MALELDAPRDHPSADALLRRHVGELGGEAAAALDAHVAACDVCRARLEALRAAQGELLTRRPFAALDAALRARDLPTPARVLVFPALRPPAGAAPVDTPLRRWAAPLAAVVLAAAAALVVVPLSAPPAPDSAGDAPSERLKSGLALSFDALRDGQAVPGDAAAAWRAGDRIQLRLTSPAPGHVVVVSLDGRGAVSVFHDADGQSLPVEAGVGRPLPGSIVLDDAPQAERVVACFSPTPLATADVVAAGSRALAAAAGAPERAGPLDLPCQQAVLILYKK